MTDDLRELLRGTAESIHADPDPDGLRGRLQRTDRRAHAVRVSATIAAAGVAAFLVVVLAWSGEAGSPTSHRIVSQPATSSTVEPVTIPTGVSSSPTTVPGFAPIPSTRTPPGLAPTTLAHCTSSQLNATGSGDPTPAGFQGTGLAGNPIFIASQYGQTYAVVDATGHWAATAELAHLPYRKPVPMKVECADRTFQTYSFTRTG